MAQLTWNQVQAPNMRDANMLMSDAMDRQGIGGAMIAKSLGNIGQDIQNRRDAEYYAQMNQYANDPLGMAQALQSGAINQNGVSQAALQRGREYLSSAATNWKNNIDTAHTDMLNKQKVQYANQIKQYNEFLANGDLASAQKVRASVLANDPTVSSEVFDGNLSFARQQADAAIMSAVTGRLGLNRREMDDIISGIYQKKVAERQDPNTPIGEFFDRNEIINYIQKMGLNPKNYDVDYIVRGVNAKVGIGSTGHLNEQGSSDPIVSTDNESKGVSPNIGESMDAHTR